LADQIVNHILKAYSDNPRIKNVKERNYSKLMECLLPHQRNELLKKYIDEAKINVTHIYLAQLLKNGFADYILTVNFDNLILRALALYNIFPSTYDMAILKDLTTTTFKEKSVVYLHGQHNGLWLLNTPDEMQKVKNTVPRIFDSIKNKRPWIFIGYSGSDPIFEHIKNLGRFDNGLYWVGYKDELPNKDVQEFLNTPNTNASIIKGYDADSFMLKLNEELGLKQPEILDNPFSALKEMLNEIVDINNEDHFKGVKERLEIAKKNVDKAINQFEEGKIETVSEEELSIDALKKEIIDLLISESYDENKISEFENRSLQFNDEQINDLISQLYFEWGNNLKNIAKNKAGKEAEDLYNKAFEKYEKAIEIQPDNHQAYYNWANALKNLAKMKTAKEAENLYDRAFEKYEKAIKVQPDKHQAYYNWANTLKNIAKTKTGKEAEDLYNKAFEKYRKTIDINPQLHEAYNNWGGALANLAKTEKGEVAETLYLQAIEKYRGAIEIKPDKHEAFYKWANALKNLAKLKGGKKAKALYYEAIEKFQKAIEVKPDKHEAYYDWAYVLWRLAEINEDKSIEKFYQSCLFTF